MFGPKRIRILQIFRQKAKSKLPLSPVLADNWMPIRHGEPHNLKEVLRESPGPYVKRLQGRARTRRSRPVLERFRARRRMLRRCWRLEAKRLSER
jgi:hypothetical protein